MPKNDKKGGKAPAKKELSEAEMKKMGMTEEQIAEILKLRTMTTDDKRIQTVTDDEHSQRRAICEKEQHDFAALIKSEEEERTTNEKKNQKEKEYAELAAAEEQLALEKKKALEKLKEDRRLYQERAAERLKKLEQEAAERRKAAEKEWEGKSEEEKVALKSLYDKQENELTQAAAQAEADEIERRKEEEERLKKGEEAAEKRAKVRAMKEELAKQGIMFGDAAEDIDGEKLLDRAWNEGEALAVADEQTKNRRVEDKAAAKIENRAALKAFKTTGHR